MKAVNQNKRRRAVSHYRCVCLILVVALLQSCGSAYPPPVDELGGRERFLSDGRSHRVNSGETLYAIAWMYDLDFVALARANQLNEPFVIYPGQQLKIDLRGSGDNVVSAAASTVVSPAQSPASTSVARATAVPAERLPETRLRRTPLPDGGGESTSVQQTPTPRPVPPQPLVTRQGTAVVSNTAEQTSWVWPADGGIIGRFKAGDSQQKGLDIGGSQGSPVRAAASGEVVYAGNGVLRYGELIILKHNDLFLSAYAHNSRLLVSEGDQVRQGEAIAELGSTGIDRNMLHFEIRRQGQPVDPLKYLPLR